MAHHKSAIKRIRISNKQNLRNRHYKSRMRSSIKRVFELHEKEAADVQFRQATSLLDKLVTKGIVHKNNAANQKARLAKHVNSLT
ncbi:MAG: 30S ribosomal protein S20 [bacterium]